MVAAIGALAGGYVAWRLAGLLPRAQGPASAAAPIFLLDTSAVIDGRIADVQATGILAGQLMVPDFVIAELQTLADSSDKQRRARGRRGLDLLDTLRKTGSNQLGIRHSSAADAAAGGVDAQLVAVARRLKARLVTADFNLGKVARLEGIEVSSSLASRQARESATWRMARWWSSKVAANGCNSRSTRRLPACCKPARAG
jgi:predicted PilT family ATPase